MMFNTEYSLDTIISAVLTLLIVVGAIRFALFWANRKRSTIQRPEWMDENRIDLTRKKGKRK